MFHHSIQPFSSRIPFVAGGRLRRLLLPLILIVSLINPTQVLPVFAIDAPNPIAPADYAEITATGYLGSIAAPPLAIPTFNWEPVIGASSYRLQVSQDIAFASKQDFVTPLTQYTPINSGTFQDGTWYWRVRVDGPTASEYSNIMTFTRTWKSPDNFPLIIAPDDGVNLQFYDSPVFSWQPMVGAAAYRLQIATTSDFSNIIYNQLTLATKHQPLAKQANAENYYWRVVPIDPHNREGTPSEVRLFNQRYDLVPQQIEPVNNSTPTFTPTFRWTAVRGAEFYRLEYSTDPTMNSGIRASETPNTTFTPTTTLENDVNYYWRVRTHSGASISEWSPIWTFRKQWYIRPVLLTPTNGYQYVRFPFFSWAPVPGAAYYKVEVDTDLGFDGPFFLCRGDLYTANTYYSCEDWNGDLTTVYWRVIPYDGSGKPGRPSEPFSFVDSAYFNTPNLVYPQYYYPPNTFPAPDTSVAMYPYEDRSASLPIFVWRRMTDFPSGATSAQKYRLQVSTISTFSPIAWEVVTENQYAVPLPEQFTPETEVDYFWRVQGQDGAGAVIGNGWSQTWKARFNLSNGLTPTTGAAPQLLRPARGSTIMETTPVLEWQPYQGADSYQVEISQDIAFGTVLNSASVSYPAYAPLESLAQRNLGKLNFGSYYWRVRAHTATGNSEWSAPWRFQIASQSQWSPGRTLGDVTNRLQISTDPSGDAGAAFDLTQMTASQDRDFWYFGFNVAASGEDANFMLYLDTDQVYNSGAHIAPLGYTLPTTPAHYPEFALLVKKRANAFVLSDVKIFSWNGSTWNTEVSLGDIGGQISYDGGGAFLEIKAPNTSIGMSESTGTYSLAWFSLPLTPGAALDSTPSDPQVPGSGPITRFASVSEKMNPLYPFNNIEGDPTTHPSSPPFFWDYPTGLNGTAPWAGAFMDVHLDQAFTSQRAFFELESNTSYYAYNDHAWLNDIAGDNSYYWRVRPRYTPSHVPGVWTQGWRFERQGFIPVNLQQSATTGVETFATPTFSWDIVEGAEKYDLEVDNDPAFASREVAISTTQTSYTPDKTLANGTYHWRVRVTRHDDITNEWSEVRQFTLGLPKPTGLTPHDPGATTVFRSAPSLCWQPLIFVENSIPVLAAWKYRVQLSLGDPNFPSPRYDQVDTQQSCYTPAKGLADGTYYWRVAMIDGDGKVGDYSPAVQFTKQYPVTTLVSPAASTVYSTPTFVWTPVHGASSYKLEVSQNPTFSPLYDSTTTNQVTFTPTKKYTVLRTYYWRVAIIDKDGKYGPFVGAQIYLNEHRVYLPMAVR